MVTEVQRDKNDLFAYAPLRFLFKNRIFLLTLKLVVSGLFIYAIYYGFAHPRKENRFTWALFWGIFWALFMVATLPTLGRAFCGICPHGFAGQYITRIGLKKRMPKWMQNRFFGISLLVIGWWGVYYAMPGIYRTPTGTAILFSVMTVVAFVFYFLYKEMDYCKYICPIGVLSRAYGKLSFTWLGTYKESCASCRTFACAQACPQGLKPFTFDKRNSMTDCTLCMECTDACEAVAFRITTPSASLFSRFKPLKAEVWAYLFILAAIPVTMTFHHGLSRSMVADEMIWVRTAQWAQQYVSFDAISATGLFAFLHALFFTIASALMGMAVASKILGKPFGTVFYDLGYAYAPLFIFASLGHAIEQFLTRGYERIVEGFAQAFGLSVDVAPLATHSDHWVHWFGILKWVGVVWALWILYKRLVRMDVAKIKKMLAFPFAASVILFYIGMNLYAGYIFRTYGVKQHPHAMHHAGSVHTDKKPVR